ncbi:MAG: queuosine precursor transporter [Paracoccaceae bacterium]
MRPLIVPVLAMACVVVASNILVQFLVGDWLTWGAFTYPFAFLVTDLTNRIHGPVAARRVVYVGFLVGLFCSFVGTQIQGEFGPLVTLRVALASGLAFLCSNLLDIAIFQRFRNGLWWRAPLISPLIASCFDTAIFFTTAFSAVLSFLEPTNDVGWANEHLPLLGFGPVVPLWVSLAFADWCVKIVLAIVALVPFRLIIANLMRKAA